MPPGTTFEHHRELPKPTLAVQPHANPYRRPLRATLARPGMCRDSLHHRPPREATLACYWMCRESLHRQSSNHALRGVTGAPGLRLRRTLGGGWSLRGSASSPSAEDPAPADHAADAVPCRRRVCHRDPAASPPRVAARCSTASPSSGRCQGDRVPGEAGEGRAQRLPARRPREPRSSATACNSCDFARPVERLDAARRGVAQG